MTDTAKDAPRKVWPATLSNRTLVETLRSEWELQIRSEGKYTSPTLTQLERVLMERMAGGGAPDNAVEITMTAAQAGGFIDAFAWTRVVANVTVRAGSPRALKLILDFPNHDQRARFEAELSKGLLPYRRFFS